MSVKKLKLGDSIFFMEANKPTSGKIEAICKVQGKVKFRIEDIESEEEKEKVIYVVNTYTLLDESKVFRSLIHMKKNLFKSL